MAKDIDDVKDDDIVAIMDEMVANGIPVISFESDGETGSDFFFERELTADEQKRAIEIADKYFPNEWEFIQCSQS